MSGIETDRTVLGWHGLVGDRRFGVRQVDEAGNFPWLSASKLPELLLYRPTDFEKDSPEFPPKRVRTPSGDLLDIRGNKLRAEIGNRVGCTVEVMEWKHGIFDDAVVSMIASTTASHVCRDAGVPSDSRRFRANIEISCDDPFPFVEDDWVGSVLAFGESSKAPAIFVTKRDVRCKMIGLDPDTAEYMPRMLKTAVRLNNNHAGVYGTVVRTGTIQTGNPIFLTKTSDTMTVP